MLTLPDLLRSRYLLYRALTDAHIPAGRAALAIDVLLGPELDQADEIGEPLEWHPAPEPFAPSPEDEAEYRAWCAEVDARWWDERIDREATLDLLAAEIEAADRFDTMMRL